MSILSQHFDMDYLPREVLECAEAEFCISFMTSCLKLQCHLIRNCITIWKNMLVCAKLCRIVSMLQIPVKAALAKNKKDKNVSKLGTLLSDSCKPLDEPLNV